MVRWRYCLVLTMLLLLPTRTGSKLEEDKDDDDERRGEDADEDDDEEDGEDDEEQQVVERPQARRGPNVMRQALPSTKPPPAKHPLECFVCAYKAETPLRACLDPTKFRVHTMSCNSPEDRCFTTVVTRDGAYEAVVRGCRTDCVAAPDNTCCELNRCNNQAFAMPVQLAEASPLVSKTSKTIPPTVLFFVTILLLLQTVVKVSFV